MDNGDAASRREKCKTLFVPSQGGTVFAEDCATKGDSGYQTTCKNPGSDNQMEVDGTEFVSNTVEPISQSSQQDLTALGGSNQEKSRTISILVEMSRRVFQEPKSTK